MISTLRNTYYRLILDRPRITLLMLAVLIVWLVSYSGNFRLDASSDTLVLENDQSLKYYRAIKARYGSDDFLFITYTPEGELFGEDAKKDLRALADKLRKLERVKSVVTLLDVPLIDSPPVTLSELQENVITLESPEADLALAQQEILDSPLYRNLLISEDGKTTALQVNFERDETYYRLLNKRNDLREKQYETALSASELEELEAVSLEFDLYKASRQQQLHDDIAAVRAIMDEHRDNAHLFLGGVPMIASDSIDFIRNDLRTFGVGVLVFLILLLAVIFHQLRWILLPMLTCGIAGAVMVGFLGWVNWPVTVVSSNFISLMLIITLSLMVHLIVRYRELHTDHAEANQYELVKETLRSKVQPSFFTAATTIVAFTSLIVSDIRPVIDFGWMMTIGISMSFLLAFTLFPAALMLLKPKRSVFKHDITGAITGVIARLIEHHSNATLLLFLLVTVLSVVGMSRLSVENRFIDYYKEHTEIYQGMVLIDEKLGGTTPMDVVIDAPADFFELEEEKDGEDDPFLDDLDLDLDEEAGITTTSYWFNSGMLPEVQRIHDYLDQLPESGKLLSISTSMQMLQSLDEDLVLDDFFLSILYKRLPQDIKDELIKPYMSEDGNQLRFKIRVYESDPDLKREALLQKVRQHLTTELGLAEEQVNITGMLVLYNNMLQSLFRSQIMTIGVVFVAILAMFMVSFRNIKMACLAIVPNMIAVAMVLGLMGWLRISLDMMTITIAAICIGIAVDDTIHYVHRITEEYAKDRDYWAAVKRSHASIGRAMYYTTITITLGFSILALSNFIPSIYFGLLTGFSMLVALIANLALLPLLIVRLKPLG